jgi:O-methyltransferase
MPGLRASLERAAGRLVSRTGYVVKRVEPVDLDEQTARVVRAAAPYTMTSTERLVAVCDSVRYLVRHQIQGAIVECGVWAGGSMMAAARTLLDLGVSSRELWLFDTFAGMPEPAELDRDLHGVPAADRYRGDGRGDPSWCCASLEEVRRNLASTGYPEQRCHFVQGMVEETVPAHAPEQIALLRLDTDWYASTRHELEHLAGRVSRNGVLIIDDYGHWQGARRAVDDWLERLDRPVLLSRLDYTARLAVLP